MAPATSNLFNWLFTDMNSFFASAEQHLRPELRGRMVGVVPVESEGSCVIAASADAKRMGVRVGTRVREARALCPGIVLVKARPAVYVQVHQSILRSVDRCAPVHKVYSIDEWAVRLTGKEQEAEGALALARRIRNEIVRDFSPWLGCSIGISQTRLLAKIACEMEKPNGLTLLDVGELPGRLDGLEPDDLPGIAEGTLRRLHEAGVRTVRQVWELSARESRRIWGSVQGEAWWNGFHGHDMPEPKTRRHSIGHANMLAPEHRDDAGARAILVRLVCKGAFRLRCHGHVAYRLHVGVETYDGRSWGAQSALDGTQDTLEIIRVFESLWRGRPWGPKRDGEAQWRPFSQVSMTLSGLKEREADVPTLFRERGGELSAALDRINRRWGANTVYLGSVQEYRHEMEDKIAFGRIPDEATLFEAGGGGERTKTHRRAAESAEGKAGLW